MMNQPSKKGMSSVTVEFNHTQILSLPTTSVGVIPAAGIGKINVPTLIRWTANILVPYTNISSAADGAFLYLAYSNTSEGNDGSSIDSGIQNTSIADYLTTLLQNTTPSIYTVDTSQVRYQAGFKEFSVESMAISDVENTAVKTNCYNSDGNYTGGDPANRLKLIVLYRIFDL